MVRIELEKEAVVFVVGKAIAGEDGADCPKVGVDDATEEDEGRTKNRKKIWDLISLHFA